MEKQKSQFIKEEKVLEIVRSSKSVQGGGWFGVTFKKRTNGELRTMSAKLSKTVKKGKNGVGLSFDPNEKGLVTVLDANIVKENIRHGYDGEESVRGAYRSFPVDGVVELKIDGVTMVAS